jgi:hypothetical protein
MFVLLALGKVCVICICANTLHNPLFLENIRPMAAGLFICALVYVILIIYCEASERESQFDRVNIQSDAGL